MLNNATNIDYFDINKTKKQRFFVSIDTMSEFKLESGVKLMLCLCMNEGEKQMTKWQNMKSV